MKTYNMVVIIIQIIFGLVLTYTPGIDVMVENKIDIYFIIGIKFKIFSWTNLNCERKPALEDDYSCKNQY